MSEERVGEWGDIGRLPDGTAPSAKTPDGVTAPVADAGGVDRQHKAITDHLTVLYHEHAGLLNSITKETDPEERTALRTELAEVRRCILQEKHWLVELNKKP